MTVHRIAVVPGENEIEEPISKFRFVGFDGDNRLAKFDAAIPSPRLSGSEHQGATKLVVHMAEAAAMDLLFDLQKLSKLAGWPLDIAIEKRAEFPGPVLSAMHRPEKRKK